MKGNWKGCMGSVWAGGNQIRVWIDGMRKSLNNRAGKTDSMQGHGEKCCWRGKKWMSCKLYSEKTRLGWTVVGLSEEVRKVH